MTIPKAHRWYKVNENPKFNGKKIVENRMKFFDWLTAHIHIDGSVAERDTESDDKNGRIRLRSSYLLWNSLFMPADPHHQK